MARPIPATDDLVALIQACLRNAGDLLADARRLLENGRPPTAHAMATLAFEEIGKSCMCMLALLPQSPLPFFGLQGQENFWKSWNSHADKLSWARAFLALLINEPAGPVEPAVERLLNEARVAHLRKLRGLYVGYADGAVLLPTAITAAEAQELIDDVQTVLDVAVQGWCHDAVLDRLREAQEHTNELTSAMDNVLRAVQTNPDATRDRHHKVQGNKRQQDGEIAQIGALALLILQVFLLGALISDYFT
jgi:AbiV family abortive infection protein